MSKDAEKLIGLAVGGVVAYELLKHKEKKEEEKHKGATTIECPSNTVCVDISLCVHEGGQCVKTCQYGCCCQMLKYTKPPEQKPKPQPKPQPLPPSEAVGQADIVYADCEYKGRMSEYECSQIATREGKKWLMVGNKCYVYDHVYYTKMEPYSPYMRQYCEKDGKVTRL